MNLLFRAFAITALFFIAAPPMSAQFPRLSKLPWEEEKVDKGLVWRHIHTDQLFGSRQNINMLELRRGRHALSLSFSQDTLIPVSVFARRDSAIAAVNGGFFNTKTGGSVTYLKADWKEVVSNDSARVAQKSEILEGAFIITADRWAEIEAARPEEYYELSNNARTVLVTGPLLLREGLPAPLEQTSLNNTRHPRTCACLTEKNRLLLLTADGRTEEAEGLTLAELTQFLKGLGCRDAINLDGGGSSTMYIKGKPDNGVVNMPCDNKKFDHLGERPVANAILIK